jgi:PEP-CTERM motif
VDCFEILSVLKLTETHFDLIRFKQTALALLKGKMMNAKFLKTSIAFGLTASAMAMTATTANAAALSQSEYDTQLGSKAGLSYETWNYFNETYVNGEREELQQLQLDLDMLSWKAQSNQLEVFFVNEGAGLVNKLDSSTNGGSLLTVFDKVSSPKSIIPESNGPLSLGERAVVNTTAGSIVNFLLQTPRNGNLITLGADSSQNPGGKQHLTAYRSGEYLILSFEDRTVLDPLAQQDWDYNDVVFAVKGYDAESTPEPATAAALFGFSMLGMMVRRRKAEAAQVADA